MDVEIHGTRAKASLNTQKENNITKLLQLKKNYANLSVYKRYKCMGYMREREKRWKDENGKRFAIKFLALPKISSNAAEYQQHWH